MPAAVCIEEREDVGADYRVDARAGVVEISLFIKGKYEEIGLIGGRGAAYLDDAVGVDVLEHFVHD